MTLPPDFKDFLQFLNAREAVYLLVGGYAVVLHGYVRATQDMDIWVQSTPENAEKVVAALRDFGLPQADELLEVFQKEKRVVGMGIPPMKIEVITSIDGVSFDECFEHRMTIWVDGVPVNYLSLNHLRQNKQASGRYKDLNDLEHLPEE